MENDSEEPGGRIRKKTDSETEVGMCLSFQRWDKMMFSFILRDYGPGHSDVGGLSVSANVLTSKDLKAPMAARLDVIQTDMNGKSVCLHDAIGGA